jgi:hypothetical protein
MFKAVEAFGTDEGAKAAADAARTEARMSFIFILFLLNVKPKL